MSSPIPLETIQRWMLEVVTHPHGVRAGIASSAANSHIEVALSDVERLVMPSSQMSSLDRLEIYGRAYFGRLLECLQVQFPAVRHVLGDEAFDGLAYGYLVAYPSQSYTLAKLGRSFDSFLIQTRPERFDQPEPSEPDFADFVIELARLEEIYSEVFDGPGPEQASTLQASDLEGLTPEAFAGSKLKLHSCVRLLRFPFPVHEYATAVRREETATVPPARPVFLVVTRREYIVRRFEITAAQFEMLAAIQAGRKIGDALEGVWQMTDEIHPDDIRNWFRTWSLAPLFSELVRQ